ncbi:hypothetical protein BDV96DRAFT_602231 [Lophiotrema nucula]|uniref:Uncharacterized protein n=1 Tax=Lophiotrema nucula TaxID=690887 RepID=A0A6A5YYW0_9PLEO|nr:hypothetical protein BDV96DRAFT_602231 [Lophiotrema nucula]
MNTTSYNKTGVTGKERAEAATPKPAATTTRPRTILLGPLQLLRRKVRNSARLRPIHDWLELHLPVSAQTIVEQDAAMPTVVYSVSLPMSDQTFALYVEMIKEHRLSDEFNDWLQGDIREQWIKDGGEEKEGPGMDLIPIMAWYVTNFGVASEQY